MSEPQSPVEPPSSVRFFGLVTTGLFAAAAFVLDGWRPASAFDVALVVGPLWAAYYYGYYGGLLEPPLVDARRGSLVLALLIALVVGVHAMKGYEDHQVLQRINRVCKAPGPKVGAVEYMCDELQAVVVSR